MAIGFLEKTRLGLNPFGRLLHAAHFYCKGTAPLHPASNVMVGTTRGFWGIGRQVPGMYWAGGKDLAADQRQLKILTNATTGNIDQVIAAKQLLQRIHKGKAGFAHLSPAEWGQLNVCLDALSKNKTDKELAKIAGTVLSLYTGEINQAEHSLKKPAEQPLPADFKELGTVANAAQAPVATAAPQAEESFTTQMGRTQARIFYALHFTLSGPNDRASLEQCDTAAITSKGPRNTNEDSVLLAQKTTGQVVLGVFDGISRRDNSGAAASHKAAETVLFELAQTDDVGFALAIANEKVYGLAGPQVAHGRPGATAAAAVIKDNQILYYSHMGDSRIYVFRNNELILLTLDMDNVTSKLLQGENACESTIKFLNKPIKAPLSGPDLASYHQIAKQTHSAPINVLQHALGLTSVIVPDDNRFDLMPNDIVIIASDGLHCYIEYQALCKTLALFHENNSLDIAEALVSAIQDQGDNLSVVVHKVPGPEKPADPDEPPPLPPGTLSAGPADSSVIEDTTLLSPEEAAIKTGNTVLAKLETSPAAAPAAKPGEKDDSSVILDATLLSPEEAARKTGETVIAQLAEKPPVAGPAANPFPPMPDPGVTADDSTEKRLAAVQATVLNSGTPRQGEPNAMFRVPGEEEEKTAIADMGPVLAAGAQGLAKGETAAPKTDPLSVLTQVPGPTSSTSLIEQSLMDIAANPAIISKEDDLVKLLQNLAILEIYFVGNEDLISSISFARLMLLDLLKELRGEK